MISLYGYGHNMLSCTSLQKHVIQINKNQAANKATFTSIQLLLKCGFMIVIIYKITFVITKYANRAEGLQAG